jgi:DnaA family protein
MYKQLSFTNLSPHQQSSPPFYWGENQALQHHLDRLTQTSSDEKFIYIWGPKHYGKTHLLQHLLTQYQNELSSIYLPLELSEHLSPECLENLEFQDMVLMDDLQLIAKQKHWEEALFHLFNRIRDKKTTILIITANAPPGELGLQLPDLISRLKWGVCYQIKEPEDDLKLKILIERAHDEGFELPLSVAQYLLSHYARDLSSLMNILQYLDQGSLEAQRQIISIPFVKKCINELKHLAQN